MSAEITAIDWSTGEFTPAGELFVLRVALTELPDGWWSDAFAALAADGELGSLTRRGADHTELNGHWVSVRWLPGDVDLERLRAALEAAVFEANARAAAARRADAERIEAERRRRKASQDAAEELTLKLRRGPGR